MPDALFELTNALLCADGAVKTPAGLALASEHLRRVLAKGMWQNLILIVDDHVLRDAGI